MSRLVLVIMVVIASFAVGGKGVPMGAGWEQYGQAKGYTQQQWDNLTQAQRDYIKSGSSGFLVKQPLAPAAPPPGPTPYSPEYLAGPQPEYSGYDDGGGSGGGSSGGGGGFMPEPARFLAEAPEWLAYLNALGLEENQFRSDIDRQKGMYGAEADRQLTDLPAGYIQQRRGISGSMETRGMSRSGEFLRKLAENRAQEGRAAGAIKGQLAFQTGALESQLAQKLMDINARKAQQELQLRSQGYQ
jgi:hypothetical protein